MTRVIVHAGFHKTGTTSLQKYLAKTRGRLAPYFAYYGQNDFLAAGARARIYAQKPFYWRRLRFRRAFRKFLSSIPDNHTIVLSRETFCGVMPGHRDWRRRVIQDFCTAGIPLCLDVADALKKRFGRDVQIEFLFTTRAQEPWIKSVYGHLVRSIHLTENFEEFRGTFPNLITLEEEAKRMAQALAPHMVHIAALEDLKNGPTGTAAAVLDLIDLPEDVRRVLPKAERENVRQSSDLEADFIALNRSGKTKEELRMIKDKLRNDAAGDR